MSLKLLMAALLVLSFLGCCDKSEIPKLREALYSESAKRRNQAALDLARCGSLAANAVPKLSQLIYDSNVGVQSSAAYALRKIDTAEARTALEQAEKRRQERRKTSY